MQDLAVGSKLSQNNNLSTFKELQRYLNTQILGQEKLVESLLVALLAEGHLLIEGPPGLAKTRAIKALAHGLECDFQRVQFTPDMLPADLTGSDKTAVSASSAARCFITLSSPMKSTVRLRRCSLRCWRRWRSGRSAWA
jgi:replication-associated recombination protein RarA